MFIPTYAIKNIWRDKYKNLLLIFIFIAIFLSSFIMISSFVTMRKIHQQFTGRKSKVSIAQFNVDPAMKSKINMEMFERCIQEDNVESYYYNMLQLVKSSELQHVIAGEEDGYIETEHQLILIGYSDIQKSEDFFTGARRIIAGEMYRNADECIISEDLAQINNIQVGDSIDISFMFYGDSEKKLVITGIYKDDANPFLDEFNVKLGYGMPKGFLYNRKNEILCSDSTISYLSDSIFPDLHSIMLYLSDSNVPQFIRGLESEYRVNATADDYGLLLYLSELTANKLSGYSVYISSFGFVLLVLTVMFSMRQRTYEIGVLRTLGLSREGVVLTFIFKNVCLVVVSCLIAFFAFWLIKDSVLSILFELGKNGIRYLDASVVSHIMNNSDAFEYSVFYNTGDELISVIDGSVMALVLAVALIAVSLISMLQLIFIMRMEAMQILQNRD